MRSVTQTFQQNVLSRASDEKAQTQLGQRSGHCCVSGLGFLARDAGRFMKFWRRASILRAPARRRLKPCSRWWWIQAAYIRWCTVVKMNGSFFVLVCRDAARDAGRRPDRTEPVVFCLRAADRVHILVGKVMKGWPGQGAWWRGWREGKDTR